MKGFILSFLIHILIISYMLNVTATETQDKVLSPQPLTKEVVEKVIVPAPPIQVEEVVLTSLQKKAIETVARVVCGEVGAHYPLTGKNVAKVISNRARLKHKNGQSWSEAVIEQATKEVKGVPHFARHCRSDSTRPWQKEVARKVVLKEKIDSDEWVTENTLWFRTHVGAHKWEKKKGWTKNIDRVGADKYHTFFEGNKTGVVLFAKY